MDQTAIKPGTPPNAPQTGIKELEATAPRPQPAPKPLAMRVLETAADLRITVVLFLLALLLVFWGTLAQVDNGVWTVVKNYFRSYFVWVPLKVVFFNSIDNTRDAIPFPGGWLIGTAMLINLLAAHAVRFKLAWSRSGIILIHVGIIIMMIGEFVTGVYAIEGSMVIQTGSSQNTVIHPGQSELAFLRTLDNKKDEVVTVPGRMLKNGATIEHADVPLKIDVLDFFVNSELRQADGKPRANRGFGLQHNALELPEVSGVDPNQRHDIPSVLVHLYEKDGKDRGIWLFSGHFNDPQWITVDGKKYQVILRFKHTTRPFTMHLNKFEHKLFPGTDKPKDFHSYINLTDPEEQVADRPIEIYMNAPLYYRGETFYQSSWTTDVNGKANGTILQVVRNPGWLLPYISCGVVALGMLVHFGFTLYRFIDRRIVR